MTLVPLLVVGLSLWLAGRGWRWWLVLPAAFALLGSAMYVTSEPPSSSGGDGDPQRLIGGALLAIVGPWALVVAAVLGGVRRHPRRAARPVLPQSADCPR
jgi:drug/metabolite transporter (DMT)-like permease